MNPKIRRITNYGGSSSGKTYSIVQAILIMTEYDGANTIVFRKVGATINTTIWEDFKVASRQLGMFDRLVFKESIHQIVFPSGAKIDIKGLDNPEKIKGLSNYKRVFKDELTEFDKSDDDQIRKRLRGMEGQQILDAFNPISETHWIKTDYIDKETWHDIPMDVEICGRKIPRILTRVKSIKMNEGKELQNPTTGEIEVHEPNHVLIQTTYLNNYWVVGSPDGSFGFYDRQCVADFEYDRINNPYLYNVYALAEWGVVQTGSEFFSSFDRGRHTSKTARFNPALPVHISVDNNHLPGIHISFWQVDYSCCIEIIQIDEICAKPPNNSIDGATTLVAEKLRELNPIEVILHGDASTKAASTFDKEKRSWMDLFIEALKSKGFDVVDKVSNKNPSVILSGEFINRILDEYFHDIRIVVAEKCQISISDYMSVQKDANGGMLKTKVKNKITGQTYEDKGHLSDTFRYLVIDILENRYIEYCNLRKRNIYVRDALINYFNPETQYSYISSVLYLIPDINGRTSAMLGRLAAGRWHIVKAILASRVLDNDELKKLCIDNHPTTTVIECSRAYFPMVRDLRGTLPEVRVKREGDDMARRINATSALVKERVLFDPERSGDEDYNAFVNSLYDYSDNRESIHASVCLSGFVQFVTKHFNLKNTDK